MTMERHKEDKDKDQVPVGKDIKALDFSKRLIIRSKAENDVTCIGLRGRALFSLSHLLEYSHYTNR